MASTIEDAERELQARGEKKKTDADEDVSPIKMIDLDVVGERGRKYVGRFHYKVPSIAEETRITQLRANILPDGASFDQLGGRKVEALTYLSVAIRFSKEFPRPDWYAPDGEHSYDMTPYFSLFGRCREHEARFRFGDALTGDAGEGVRGTDDAPAGGGEAPVGRKVPPPSKRRETLAGDDEGGA
jgi:hypothetical protein